MALDSYTGLSTAIGTWATRPYTTAQTDEFILLAEAAFKRRLKGYQRETTDTLTTDANGEAALPSGFAGMLSVYYGTTTDYPLQQVAWGALRVRNPSGTGGIPSAFAISGTKFKVDYLAAGDFTATYKADLTPLSANDTSNWLLALAPDAYLFMCKAMARAFEEEWDAAAGLEAKANGILDELGLQSDLAQFGRATMTIRGATP